MLRKIPLLFYTVVLLSRNLMEVEQLMANQSSPNASRDFTQTYWADLFLSLLYAGTILLFLAWVGLWQLPDAPPALVAATRSAWSWGISGVGGALIAAVFQRRLSALTLVWTVALAIALAVGAYLLRKPCVLPTSLASERWEMYEANVRTSVWDVDFTGSGFSCPPDASFPPTTTCKATGWGSQRAVERYSAPKDQNHCVFFGTLSGNTINGTYNCNNGGPFPWSAKVLSRTK
jgi:multisubunit Na+/H+ antiporter MnhG subunit